MPQDAATLRSQAWNAAMMASPGALDLRVPASAITGSVPEVLRGGRMLSNGPGWTRIGDRTAHPFDGHGYLRAFHLEADGSCRLHARFVETPTFRAEAEKGALVHRGLATNLPPPFWRNLRFGPPRNVANTTVVRWGERLLAGWEGGAPTALDPDTLETQGEERLGGALDGQATLAHMRPDRARDRLVLCSVKNGKDSGFTFREVDRAGVVQASRQVTLPGMMFTHDFAFTPSWYVLGGNPLQLRPWELAKMLVGASTMLRSIAVDETRPGQLHLIPRDGGGPVRTVTLPDRTWVIHFGGAFERDGAVIVDACVFHRFAFGEELGYTGPTTPFDPALPDARGPQRLYRITVPPGSSEARWELLVPHGVDFPRVHPDHEGVETPQLFGATRADTRYSDPFDAVIRVDLRDPERPPSLWAAPENVFVGEPLFAPDPGDPSAGHVLVIVTEPLEERSTLAILDARALERGPVARIPLPLLPVGFHGEWEPPENQSM